MSSKVNQSINQLIYLSDILKVVQVMKIISGIMPGKVMAGPDLQVFGHRFIHSIASFLFHFLPFSKALRLWECMGSLKLWGPCLPKQTEHS